ncbi:Uncharacterised protein [uncultured archaeon]|nr:Uncharacterised protein [uncultured archaeon]
MQHIEFGICAMVVLIIFLEGCAIPSNPICGNNVCESPFESSLNCPSDCGETSMPCADTDNGLDYNTYGYVQAPSGNIYDICLDANKLWERYCDGNAAKSKEYICPNSCNNGACVNTQSNYNSPEFEKLLSSGNPKQKFNFMFIASNFSKEDKLLFLHYVNDFLFGEPGNQSRALFRDYLYKNEKDKFNIYYYIKDDANYGGKDEFFGNSYTAYNEIYGDLNGIKDSGTEVKEEIDQFIILINDSGTSTSAFWPDKSILNSSDEVITKTQVILLYAGNSADPKFDFNHTMELMTPILAHELGHAIGGLADEYYAEDKGWYLPALSKRVNTDKIGCQKWCSGNIDQTSQCYAKYQSYLGCVKYLNDVITQKQQYLGCFSQANEAGLNSCNFGIDCELDTGCYWPMQGTLGFKPYLAGIMNTPLANSNYGQYYEQLIREKLGSGIKLSMQSIRIDVNRTFTQIKKPIDGGILYTFNIPFWLFSNNSQEPIVYTLNGRKYTITFDANIFGNKNRASIYFNDNGDGYIAKLDFMKSFKDDPNGELTINDKYPVTLYARYDDTVAQKQFIIDLKDGLIQ